MSLRTPLGRVRGLGSAKQGTDHWWMQRVTAVALVPLVLWFVIFLLGIVDADYDAFKTALALPYNAVLSILFLAVLFYHAVLGLQVVIEDYVHSEWLKITSLMLIKFAALLLAVSAVFSVLRIAFGGSL
jgi:succinate dehydrogenase / fumarate reductase membrane anchor subunit